MRGIRRILLGLGACLALPCASAACAWAAGAPVVEGVGEPNYGSAEGGYRSSVQGRNFEGVTAVEFGTTPAAFHVSSSTEIGVTVPAGSGVVDVRVTTAEGTSEITYKDRFVYVEGPEYGRCQKEPPAYEGDYHDKGCTIPIPEGEGASAPYEWYPAFGRHYLVKTGFTLSGSAITLETAAKVKITCSAVKGSGEYTGDHTLSTGALTLTGCALSKGSSCQSAGAGSGEIATASLVGQVGGYIEKTRRTGVELSAADPEPLAEFSCGATPGVLSGSVIVEATENKMTIAASWKGKEKKGTQEPTAFDGGSPVALTLELGSSEAPAGLKAKITQTNEEEVELVNEL